MSGEIEAAGDAITGGLVARAIDRDHGAAHTAHGICQNCATALTGDFCHACGQPGHIHRSLAAIWHDLAHGVLHFEGKIWRTLPMLAARPGDLTRRYIAGERARFVSPLALFLFSVFLMFAIFSALGSKLEAPAMSEQDRAKTVAGLKIEQQAKTAELARLEAAIARGGNVSAAKSGRQVVVGEIQAIETALDGLETGIRTNFSTLKTGWDRFDQGVKKASENPNLMLYKLQSNAYKYSWALIPISVPFVWLLFAWWRGVHVYDHTVFVTYSLSFMMLFAILLTVLGAIGISSGALGLVALIVPPIHMQKQLKGAYQLSTRRALPRTLALVAFAFVSLVVFAAALLGLGFVG